MTLMVSAYVIIPPLPVKYFSFFGPKSMFPAVQLLLPLMQDRLAAVEQDQVRQPVRAVAFCQPLAGRESGH